jgi:excisionase family DNA binding protein
VSQSTQSPISNTATGDAYLTTADVLAYLKTAPRTLYRWLARGDIPAVRIGHQWRFRKDDLDRWVEERARRQSPKARTTRGELTQGGAQ